MQTIEFYQICFHPSVGWGIVHRQSDFVVDGDKVVFTKLAYAHLDEDGPLTLFSTSEAALEHLVERIHEQGFIGFHTEKQSDGVLRVDVLPFLQVSDAVHKILYKDTHPDSLFPEVDHA